MSRKKTVRIEWLLEQVNTYLKTSAGLAEKERRQGQISLLKRILHETDNYRGFGYLIVENVPEGELPGVWYSVDDVGKLTASFDNTDDTRIVFYSV